MKKFIVITSIFEPTEAVKKFAELSDYKLIVVGDKKTPDNWQYSNVVYLSIDAQLAMESKLAQSLPYNHYCRKMMGYIYSHREAGDIIIDTDDDNIPTDSWAFPEFEGTFDMIPANKGFFNIYDYFTDQKIWPRGLPLHLINADTDTNDLIKSQTKVGIWQGLADEDPDVDAIYRLTSDVPCVFKKRTPIVLGENSLAPFNTQNTAIVKELFPLLYLPCHVTFRFTDILRGTIAQPILWSAGFSLGFTDATVIQKRNPHDYFKDFVSEIPMYLNNEKAAQIAQKISLAQNSVADNLYNVYQELEKNQIVIPEEIKLLEAWLEDISIR
ncbi:STELLO glycosyltransferase family protein [Niabella insulamsoli]|uniref:STELLO glycosyltransferase family protein n=1 Tax=Niabella insulamsoli TaxID=3144874 RepID=UPI0031FDBF8B